MVPFLAEESGITINRAGGHLHPDVCTDRTGVTRWPGLSMDLSVVMMGVNAFFWGAPRGIASVVRLLHVPDKGLGWPLGHSKAKAAQQRPCTAGCDVNFTHREKEERNPLARLPVSSSSYPVL